MIAPGKLFPWILPLALLGACGYPDFQFLSSTGGTGSGGSGGIPTTSSSSTSSSSSAMGGGGSSSSSSSSSGTCDLFAPGNGTCGAGMRCAVVDENTGKPGCELIGPKGKNAGCVDDADCGLHTFCDQRTQTCALLCTSSNDCGTGNCVAAHNSQKKTIPGVNVCTADCDPTSASSCGADAICAYDSSVGGLDCFVAAGNLAAGSTCEFLNDCAPTLVCVGGYCDHWCSGAFDSPIALSCTGTFSGCVTFTNYTVNHAGQSYGSCY